MPCVNRPANGSSRFDMAGLLHGAGEEARIEQVQDRVLDAADILVDRQPAIRPCGAVGAVSFHGSVKRRSTRTSRRRCPWCRFRAAPPPHCGQSTCFQVGWRSSGLPGRSKVTSSGSVTGRSCRHRHHAAGLAMDDRDRAAPVALARNAPVAQAVIDLALRHRTVAAGLALQPLRHFFLRRVDRHAVEEARIDHAAVAVIGRVGDDEASPGPGPAGRPPAYCRGRIC